MGEAAEERGLNIQYCMAFVRHLLHSLMLPQVTQIRVSDDYMLNPVSSASIFTAVSHTRPIKLKWS